MTIDSNWNSAHAIVIDNTKVSGTSDLTDFPVLLDENNFLSDVFSNTQSGGEDLRFSTDSAGDNEIPLEVVKWDQTTPAAEVWVKIPTLYCDQDTRIYVHYDNSSASAYAETDTYGAQNVWNTNYKMVQHLTNNANDSTSNNNDGTVYGATSGVTGQIAEAYSFDGTDDYISITDDDTLDFGASTDFTIKVWIKTSNTTDNFKTIVDKQQSSSYYDAGWGLYQSGSGIEYSIADGSDKVELSTGTIDDGDWHHITLVADRDGNVKLYIDATEQTSITTDMSSVGDISNGEPVRIGGNDGWGRYYTGAIDESSVIQSLLSSDWITTEYNNQSSPSTFASAEQTTVETDSPTNISSTSAQLNGTLNDLQGNSSLDVYFEYGTSTSYGNTTSAQTISSVPTSFSDTISGLTALTEYHYRSVATDGSNYWYGLDISFVATDLKDVDEMQSDWQEGTLTDVVGTNNDTLELAGDYALDFDGADDYVSIGDVFFDGWSELTVEAYINPTSLASNSTPSGHGGDPEDYIIHKRGDNNDNFGLTVATGGTAFYIDTGTNYTLVGTVPSTDVWTHIAVVYDGSEMRLYIDGSLDNSKSASGTIVSTSNTVEIGASTQISDYFDGNIRDVRVWNIARTQTEIDNNKDSVLTGSEAGLVAYYPTDEGSGSTLYDDAGANDGAINGAAWTTTDYPSSGNRLSPQLDLSSLSIYSDSLIEWTATLNGQSLTIETRYSLDGGSSWSSWQTCTSGSALPGLSSGDDLSNALLECRQTLSTSDTTTTPELERLAIYIAEYKSFVIALPVIRIENKVSTSGIGGFFSADYVLALPKVRVESKVSIQDFHMGYPHIVCDVQPERIASVMGIPAGSLDAVLNVN